MGFEALARFGVECYQLGMKCPYLVDDKSFIFLMPGAKRLTVTNVDSVWVKDLRIGIKFFTAPQPRATPCTKRFSYQFEDYPPIFR
jgi:hypothetical protein